MIQPHLPSLMKSCRSSHGNSYASTKSTESGTSFELDSDQDTFNVTSYLVQVSGRPLFDELGLGTFPPQGVRVEVPHLEGEHIMDAGGKIYRIPVGIFPTFDHFMETWESWEKRREAQFDAAIKAGERPAMEAFPVDAEFISDLEKFKERARAAIARRKDVY